MQLRVVTPQGVWMDAEVEEVRAPGINGEFGVLPGHIPFVSVLVPGLVTWRERGHIYSVPVGEGLAEVRAQGEVVLVVQSVEAETKMLATPGTLR